jgi:hypothetical protein
MVSRYDEARNLLLAALEDINRAMEDGREIGDFVILATVEEINAFDGASYSSYSNGLTVPPHVRVGTLTLAAKRAIRQTLEDEEDE